MKIVSTNLLSMIQNCIVKSKLKRKPDITWILPLLLSEYFFLQIVLFSKLWLPKNSFFLWDKKENIPCALCTCILHGPFRILYFLPKTFFRIFSTVWMVRFIVIAFLILEISENSLLYVFCFNQTSCSLSPKAPVVP